MTSLSGFGIRGMVAPEIIEAGYEVYLLLEVDRLHGLVPRNNGSLIVFFSAAQVSSRMQTRFA